MVILTRPLIIPSRRINSPLALPPLSKAWLPYLSAFSCDSPEAEFQIIGEVKGGHPKGEFRSRLQEVLNSIDS